MSIDISGHTFKGPFEDSNDLKDQSGVYVILNKKSNGKWGVVDVGESATLKTRVNDHDREECWQKYSNFHIAALYVGEVNRESIATQIRQDYNPPCGEK